MSDHESRDSGDADGSRSGGDDDGGSGDDSGSGGDDDGGTRADEWLVGVMLLGVVAAAKFYFTFLPSSYQNFQLGQVSLHPV